MENIKVIKKNGKKVPFDRQKIKDAIKKSADRVLVHLSDINQARVCNYVIDEITELGLKEIRVEILHNLVELALDKVNPTVARAYREYRNYKTDFVTMLDEAYRKSELIQHEGDRENSNVDSALVSSKRVLSYNEFNKLLYNRFFLSDAEKEACDDGFIYIHDQSSRRDTYNCSLFDAATVMKNGFEMGNMFYNECTTIDKALDVLGDIMTVKASQQYGK